MSHAIDLTSRAATSRAIDADEFGLLFRRYHPQVLRFFRRRLSSRDAACEAAQETFARAFARIDQLRDPERVRPWLFAFARNVLHEAYYARRREHRAPPDRGPGAAPTPEALLLDHELGRAIDSALAHLPEGRRAALLLRVDDERDYPEIARRFGWSRAKVKNEIHRARLHLRRALHCVQSMG
jgi:RNA polymerase sigma factor (sigma-70 family)